jgi:hypothetical protein
MKKILLGTFVTKEKLDTLYKKLEDFYSIKKEETFLFSIMGEENLLVTFKMNNDKDFKLELKNKIKNTVQIHKKGNCFYTINALNKLIEKDFELSEGNVDYKSFKVDWEKYQNKILLINNNVLKIQEIKKVIL